jgi:hypothetical protein
MAGVLLRAQREGRPLTAYERSRIDPMITQSANPPTNELWSSLGGVPGMDALDAAFGLSQTTPTSPWGLTSTSAHDQVELTRQVLIGEYGPLDPPARGVARHYMTRVVPSQRWGISAGVPAGWTVALKNGFAPSRCCGWRLNSTGYVEEPDGQGGYAATVLTDGWPDEASGIVGNETVSRAIAATLTAPDDVPLTCDWDGDGDDTPGVQRGRSFFLRNANSSGPADAAFVYGIAGDVPVCGDWDGDGDDTVGVRRGRVWYLRNTNSGGGADVTVVFGAPADVPIVGDWDGDGDDTVGVHRAFHWFLRNSNTTGDPDLAPTYGRSDDIPVVGDWDGDGDDTPGVRRRHGPLWHLRNSSTAGPGDVSFYYGALRDELLTGDWDGDGDDTPGVHRGRMWYLRNSNTTGGGEIGFAFGR